MASERAKRRVERLLDQIDEASEQRDWETVGELSKDVLALGPDNADTLADRGVIIAGDPESCIKAIQMYDEIGVDR